MAVSRRAAAFDSSGIRKAFDLAARLADPINLSIGQPDFAMPEAARAAAEAAAARVDSAAPARTATRRRRASPPSASGWNPARGRRRGSRTAGCW